MINPKTTITLQKMISSLNSDNQAQYELPETINLDKKNIQDKSTNIKLNNIIGSEISLEFTGKITCQGCNKIVKKCYQPGYCFICTKRLARCDLCIVKPELCHYYKGTCREPTWGEAHCMKPHIVYLANSSGLKVGITREQNIPHRWIDQGAIQALPILRVPTRLNSGQCEVIFSNLISDKTNWRAMLKGEVENIDLIQKRDELLHQTKNDLLKAELAGINIEYLKNQEILQINYPVLTYPVKINSLNFDKTPQISGKLMGIKGQYFILDCGVLNIRKFSGYEVKIGL